VEWDLETGVSSALMISKLLASLAFGAGAAVLTGIACSSTPSQCTTDLDCAGNLYCRNGSCVMVHVNPPPAGDGGGLFGDATETTDFGFALDAPPGSDLPAVDFGPRPDMGVISHDAMVGDGADGGFFFPDAPPVQDSGPDAGEPTLTAIPMNIPSSVLLTAVHGSSSTNVWIVGTAGTILVWDGMSFSQKTPAESADFDAVWVASMSEAWVAEAGTAGGTNLQHWTGSSFTVVPSSVAVRAIYGFSASDVFFAGDNGVIQKWNGTTLSTVNASVMGGGHFLGLWGADNTEIWAVGGIPTGHASDQNALIYRGTSDGTTWTQVFDLAMQPDYGALAVWGSSLTDVYFAGTQQLWHTMGGAAPVESTVPMVFPIPSKIHALGGTSASNFWVANQSGNIAHWNGMTFQLLLPMGNTIVSYTSLWAGPSSVWLVGNNILTGAPTAVLAQ
jgi:hypothetical protein